MHTLAITIGFEQETYVFSEPAVSQSQELICIAITSGSLANNHGIQIRPEWNAITAAGIQKYNDLIYTINT